MRKYDPWWISPVCIFIGAALGMVLFLWSAVLVIGNPTSKSLLSIHGILVKDNLNKISETDHEIVKKLLENGSIIDANSFLSSMNGFYSTTIQVLIATFFVFGVISFFIIKQHSTNQVEAAVDEITSKRFETYLRSVPFQDLIRKEVSLISELESENLQERFESIGEFAARLEQIENRLAREDNPEEE